MLALFVVYPIILTAQTSFTNYGDGTRSTKEETVAQIIGSSVVQTPDAPRYNLSVATDRLHDHRTLHLLPRQPGRRHPLQGHRGRARGARRGRGHRRERQDHRRRRLHLPDRQGGQRRRGRDQGVHRPHRQRSDPRARHHDGVRGHHHARVRRGRRHHHRRHDRHGLHRAAAGRPRVLRRRRRQPRVRPVLEGQRRAGQLQEAPHQPPTSAATSSASSSGPSSSPPCRWRRRSSSACCWPSPQRPPDARPEGLPGDPDHALRHSRASSRCWCGPASSTGTSASSTT